MIKKINEINSFTNQYRRMNLKKLIKLIKFVTILIYNNIILYDFRSYHFYDIRSILLAKSMIVHDQLFAYFIEI